MIFRNHLINALLRSDREALSPAFEEVTLGSGQVLFEPESPVDYVYFPGGAVLSEVIVLKDGRSVEIATIGVESLAGLLPALLQTPSRTRLYVQISGSAIRLPAEKLRARVAESPALLELLLRYLNANIAQAEQSVACNAVHDVPARLSRWLLMTEDRTGHRIIPLTQEYLAVMVGVQRTTISIAATGLKDSGIIRYSRGQVEILDRHKLEGRACECYRSISDAYQKLLKPAS